MTMLSICHPGSDSDLSVRPGGLTAFALAASWLIALTLSSPAFAQDVFSTITDESGAYTSHAVYKIAKHWKPPQEKKWGDLIVRFKIDSDGTASEIETSHSSGFPKIDRLAMRSVREAAPYAALPSDMSAAAFQIHFRSKEPLERPPAAPAKTPDLVANVDLIKIACFKEQKRRAQEQARDIDFGPYMSDMWRRIRKTWRPIATADPTDVKVTFNIEKDGQISQPHISLTSGNTAVDRADLEAVRFAAPFGPLPDGVPKVTDLEFWFKHTGRLGWDKEGKYWVGWIGRN